MILITASNDRCLLSLLRRYPSPLSFPPPRPLAIPRYLGSLFFFQIRVNKLDLCNLNTHTSKLPLPIFF